MSWTKDMKSLASTGDIHSLTKNHKHKRNRMSSQQKTKNSMQPCDELAAIFGVPPKPTITRTKC